MRLTKHTQLEYGRLLKYYLEKVGLRVGLYMESGCRGWEGSLRIARGRVQDPAEITFSTELYAAASVYVDDEGYIRLYYSEPIVIDPEKKAKKDALDEQMQIRESDFCCMGDGFSDDEKVELSEVESKSIEADDVNNTADTIEVLQRIGTEDLENITEKQELELLRALNEVPYQITLYGRKNENRLVCHGRYRMDACSRNSAKKAAEYILDELIVWDSYIMHLSEQLGFERVKPQEEWNGWEEENVIDDFSQIDAYIAAAKKAEEERKAAERRAQLEEYAEWKPEWGDAEEYVRSMAPRIEEKDPTVKLSELFRWHLAVRYIEESSLGE